MSPVSTVFHTVLQCSQKCCQNDNIHSIVLDVHALTAAQLNFNSCVFDLFLGFGNKTGLGPSNGDQGQILMREQL